MTYYLLSVRPTAVYLILNNVLYTAPDIYTLMSTKLVRNCDRVPVIRSKKSVLDKCPEHDPDFPGHFASGKTGLYSPNRPRLAHC